MALRILTWAVLGASVLLGLGVTGAVWFSRTERGRDLALEWALARVSPWVNGTLEVRSLAPRGLLGGATLFDVELFDHAGHPVVRVDSLRARYSLASWFALPPTIADVELAGLVIDLAPEGRRVELGELIVPPRDPGVEEGEGLEEAEGPDIEGLDQGEGPDEEGRPGAGEGLAGEEGRDPVGDLVEEELGGADGSGGSADFGDPEHSEPADGAGPLLRIRGLRVRDGSFVIHSAVTGRKTVSGIELDLPLVELAPDPGRFAVATVADAALSLPMGTGTLALAGIRGTAEIGSEGIFVTADRFLLPNSEGSGRIESRPRGDALVTTYALAMDRLALPDIDWIDPRFDHGAARGAIVIDTDPTEPRIEFDNLEVDLGEGGRLALTGALLPGDTLRLEGLEARPDRFATTELEPFLDGPLPVTGLLAGEARFDGFAGRLEVAGNLALLDETGRDTLVHLAGRGTDLGAEGVAGVELAATSLDYGLLAVFAPELDWRGRGRATIRADGRLETGLAIVIQAEHGRAETASSSVALTGNFYGDTAISVIDLDATVDPLDLGTVAALFPEITLEGAAWGSLSLRGELDRLAIAADLRTNAGRVNAEGTVNARNFAAGYEIRASSDALDLSHLSRRFPDSTVVAGRATLNARGHNLETLRGAFTLNAGASRIGALRVDSTELNAWVDDDGILHVERFHTDVGGVAMEGSGVLGFAPGVRADGVELKLSSPSVHPLRYLFMGANLVAWDELPSIEQELLVRMDGVDPDTFPRARDIRFDARLDGEARIYGGLDDLAAATVLTLDGLEYGHAGAARVAGDIVVSGLRVAGLGQADTAGTRIGVAPRDPSDPVVVAGTLTADSVALGGRNFHHALLEGELRDGNRARLRILARPTPGEAYEGQGVVRVDEGAGRVDLDRLTLALADRRWNLLGPARFEWDADGYTVGDFGLIRPGGDGLRLVANGRLARGSGASEFELRANDLDLAVLGHILQLETPPAGILNAALSARGTGTNPGWIGDVGIDGARYRTLAFDSLRVHGRYADLALATVAESWTGDRRTLRADGSIPLDLRFDGDPETPRDLIPDSLIDLAIIADSLPAEMVLAGMAGLEEVHGTVTAAVDLGGRPSDFEPDGEILLDGVSAFMPPFGIAVSDVAVAMTLSPDGVVRVAGSGVSGGVMEVAGTVDLGQPSDSIPLSLVFRPRGFQVVDRADMEAAISSDSVTLTGNWDFPFIEGEVAVEEGTVFMEEFQRTAEVVDLYDPALFSAATARIGAGGEEEEAAAGERIPFLENLRVLVDARVGRGNWLRSRRMNVETTGDLSLTFDRRGSQLVLAGDMAVQRGTYKVGPRTLRITEGAFQFVGTPGFNPGLSISADTRLRTREGQPLVITADISGTLLTPTLTFTSDAEAAISEADLVNYLVIGRPTSVLVGTAGAPVGAGRDLLLGELANEIGYFLVRELNLDHLSVSQSEQTLASAVFGTSSVKVEAGRYVLDDLFLTAVYQRGFCADPTLPVNSGAVRFEMGMPRDVRFEGFLEGRCTREGYRGLGETALALERIWGFSLFREWGY